MVLLDFFFHFSCFSILHLLVRLIILFVDFQIPDKSVESTRRYQSHECSHFEIFKRFPPNGHLSAVVVNHVQFSQGLPFGCCRVVISELSTFFVLSYLVFSCSPAFVFRKIKYCSEHIDYLIKTGYTAEEAWNATSIQLTQIAEVIMS